MALPAGSLARFVQGWGLPGLDGFRLVGALQVLQTWTAAPSSSELFLQEHSKSIVQHAGSSSPGEWARQASVLF